MPTFMWNLRALRLLAKMPTSESDVMLNVAAGKPCCRR